MKAKKNLRDRKKNPPKERKQSVMWCHSLSLQSSSSMNTGKDNVKTGCRD